MTKSSLLRDIYKDIVHDREMNQRTPSWKDYLRPLVVPQLCCLTIYRLSHFLYQKNLSILSKILRNFNVVIFSIDIQPGAQIQGGCFIGHSLGVVIGPNVFIDEGCQIWQGVTITPGKNPGLSLSPDDRVKIEKNVRIYAGAKVIGNISIGEGVTVGANAVVLNSVLSGETVIGIPARSIKRKNDIYDEK